MAQRGRKSASALAVRSAASAIETIPRPDAPYDLTDEESDVWRGVIDSMPADWFSASTFPLLVQYCRHIVRSHRVAQLVNEAEKSETLDVSSYNALLVMQDRESRAIATLATKMRLAQQSTIAPDKKKAGAIGMKRPWQS